MPFFITMVLACAWWTATILPPLWRVVRRPIPVFAAIGTILLVVPAGDLGQREHLLVAAVLPYLALFACSLDGARPGRREAVAAGVLAGLGCALKPRYGAVFAVLECLALARGMRTCRLKPLAAIAAFAGYGVLVAVCALPICAAPCHWRWRCTARTDVSFLHLLVDSARAAVRRGGGRSAAGMDLAARYARAQSVADTGAVRRNQHGDLLHRRQGLVLSPPAGDGRHLLALVLWAASALFHRSTGRDAAAGRRCCSAGIAGLVFLVAAFQRLEPEVAQAVQPQDSTVAKLERLIRQNTRAPTSPSPNGSLWASRW